MNMAVVRLLAVERGIPLQQHREPDAMCGFCQCPSDVCVRYGVGAEPEYSRALKAIRHG